MNLDGKENPYLMKLIHYTDTPFTFDRKFKYCPNRYITEMTKPNGLWVSVEGETDWKEWCERENFRLDCLKTAYEVKLRNDAHILHLNTEEKVFELIERYPYAPIKGTIDWDKISRTYQGIIIAPYQWKARLASKSRWYYGWDCASGCIWDMEAIEEVKLIDKVVI